MAVVVGETLTKADEIRQTLRMVGTAADRKNRPAEFKTPERSAAIDMHVRYGMVIRVRRMASSKF